MVLALRSFHAYPHTFIGLNNASVFCLAILLNATGFPALLRLNFARRCCWHRDFLRAFVMISLKSPSSKVNEVKTTQFSGIVEVWFIDCPLLLFFAFRCIGHIFPHLWPQSVWSGGRFVSSSISPRTMYIRQVGFRSIKWILWKLPTHLTILDLHGRSNSRRYFLQRYIQGCICSPGHVGFFQWKREWFFSRHVQFDSGLHVMTVKKVAWNGPEFTSSFHHHTTTSLEVGLKKIRLIFLEDFLVLLLALGDPG